MKIWNGRGHLIFNAVGCWGVFGWIKVDNITDNDGEKNFCRLSKIVNRLFLDLEGGHLSTGFGSAGWHLSCRPKYYQLSLCCKYVSSFPGFLPAALQTQHIKKRVNAFVDKFAGLYSVNRGPNSTNNKSLRHSGKIKTL